ncbi:hypothetical protein [Salinibacterium sp. SWN167]|uniref:hypothetical protein n=1 Tax=Salinibacterium sp. SWN167 TaxID=2792054 RepID=UPI0018CD3383|nr:hypothetical protein [Salinibacterium sp. SWN167]MBH0084337.1 hypothetical protein [Salinibacterium sp. SWN167]
MMDPWAKDRFWKDQLLTRDEKATYYGLQGKGKGPLPKRIQYRAELPAYILAVACFGLTVGGGFLIQVTPLADRRPIVFLVMAVCLLGAVGVLVVAVRRNAIAREKYKETCFSEAENYLASRGYRSRLGEAERLSAESSDDVAEPARRWGKSRKERHGWNPRDHRYR